MHRRKFLDRFSRALVLLSVASAAFAPSAQAQPRFTITAAKMQAAMAEKFPLRYPIAGLFDLALQAPALGLLPAENRIHADIPVEAAGQALRRSYSGSLDLDFALRYEPSDRTLRAHEIRVNALRFPGLRAEISEMLNTYAPVLAAQALREVVLHQLTDKDLALADGLGMEPGTITVTSEGLVIQMKMK